VPYVRVAPRLRRPQGRPEPDPLDRTADLNRTFSQFREEFEYRRLPCFGRSSEIPALTRENVVIPTTGGGEGTRTLEPPDCQSEMTERCAYLQFCRSGVSEMGKVRCYCIIPGQPVAALGGS
jgi:hypothetical protein